MSETFVSVSADGLVRMFGYENGAGHAILVPAEMLGDPLATGGKIETACGRSVDCERLKEKFLGDRTCARCAKWVESTGGTNDIEAARAAMADRYAEPKDGTDAVPVVQDAAPEAESRAVLIEQEKVKRQTGACDGYGATPAPGSHVLRDDHSVSVPDDYNGKTSAPCPACERVIAVNREGRIRRHNAPAAPAVRESAPAAPAPAVDAPAAPVAVQEDLFVATLGKSVDEMRDALDAYYADGNAVPSEIASLPDPKRVRVDWTAGSGARAPEVLKCEFKGAVAILNMERTHGKCPACATYIPLQDERESEGADKRQTCGDAPSKIGTHNVYGVPSPVVPAGKRLVSRSIDIAEHGSVPGDTADATKRRADETVCDRTGRVVRNSTGGRKTCVGCKRSVDLVSTMRKKNGKLVKVWLYPRHYLPITDALTEDSFRRAGADGRSERKVTPRGSGADAGKGQRDHGTVDGCANTGSQNMAPVRPGGWVGKAGTMVLPATVRPGVDPEVSGTPCPVCEELPEIAHKGMNKTQRRKHSRALRAYWEKRDAERAAQRAEDIEAGRIIPGAVRRELRKAASVGSFAEGTVSGKVAHGGTRPAVAPKLTPRGATRVGKVAPVK